MAKGEKPDWLDDDDLEVSGKSDAFEADELLEESAPLLKRRGSDQKADEGSGQQKASAGKSSREPVGKLDSKKMRTEREIRHSRAVRPGEHEISRSPLILGLAVTALVLGLLSLTYWFMIGRSTLERELIAIDEQLSAGQYAGGIQSLEAFVRHHPTGEIGNKAKVKLGKARIDKELKSSVPDWKLALAAVNQFVTDCREVAEFSQENESLFNYSFAISMGALDVAAKQKNEELIGIANEAAVLVDRYGNPDKPPVENQKQIRAAKEIALAAILKNDTIKNTLAEIDRFRKDGRSIDALASRRRLVDRYPDQEKERKINQIVDQILDSEVAAIRSDEVGRPANKQENSPNAWKPFMLIRRSRTSSGDVSEGRTVWASIQGCVFGVDTITGDPIWRRPIGQETPFFPIVVDAAVPALLVFDTRSEELVLLNRNTGELIWRQSVDGVPTGPPLVQNTHVFVGSTGNKLSKIDLQTGEIVSALTFSQQIISPAVLLKDGEHLVVAGRDSISYTLSLKPFKCIKASYTGQRPNAIRVPLIAMGSAILMIENDTISSSLMRVFDAAKPQSPLKEIGSQRVNAQVLDPPTLRGNQLFVAAENEQLSAFTVSDDPDSPKLLPLANPPQKSEYNGPIYLKAGPDGRLWTVSDHLKRFSLSSDSLAEVNAKDRIYIGGAGQPLQSIGKSLFVGRKHLECEALSLIQVDGDDWHQPWRTVLGAGLLSVADAGKGSSVCVTKAGDIFLVNTTQIETLPFPQQVETTLKLPDGLSSPLVASSLPGGRTAVACGGREPKLWVVSSIGRIEQEFAMDEAPVAAPLPIAGGVVVPLKSKLYTVAIPNVAKVDDFLAPVQDAVKSPWVKCLPLDATHLAVIDDAGKVLRIEFRTAPKPHLQAMDSVALGSSVDIQPIADSEHLFVADSSGRISALKIKTFEKVAEVKLDQPAVGNLVLVGGHLLVTSANGDIVSLDAAKGLNRNWSVPTNGQLLATSAALVGNNILLPTRTGKLLLLDSKTGVTVAESDVGHPVDHGPISIGGSLFVSSIDGALYRIPSSFGGSQ